MAKTCLEAEPRVQYPVVSVYHYLRHLSRTGTRVYTKHRRLHKIFCYLRRINLETLCFSWVETVSKVRIQTHHHTVWIRLASPFRNQMAHFHLTLTDTFKFVLFEKIREDIQVI